MNDEQIVDYLTQLERDNRRMDWLEKNKHCDYIYSMRAPAGKTIGAIGINIQSITAKTVREMIDEKMNKEAKS